MIGFKHSILIAAMIVFPAVAMPGTYIDEGDRRFFHFAFESDVTYAGATFDTLRCLKTTHNFEITSAGDCTVSIESGYESRLWFPYDIYIVAMYFIASFTVNGNDAMELRIVTDGGSVVLGTPMLVPEAGDSDSILNIGEHVRHAVGVTLEALHPLQFQIRNGSNCVLEPTCDADWASGRSAFWVEYIRGPTLE